MMANDRVWGFKNMGIKGNKGYGTEGIGRDCGIITMIITVRTMIWVIRVEIKMEWECFGKFKFWHSISK